MFFKAHGAGAISSIFLFALNVKSTYWFSHDAKAFVRIVREYLTPEGERHLLLSEELKSFKVHASEE